MGLKIAVCSAWNTTHATGLTRGQQTHAKRAYYLGREACHAHTLNRLCGARASTPPRGPRWGPAPRAVLKREDERSGLVHNLLAQSVELGGRQRLGEEVRQVVVGPHEASVSTVPRRVSVTVNCRSNCSATVVQRTHCVREQHSVGKHFSLQSGQSASSS